ncbi:MAG: hypothetical protein JWR26_2989 [Pedosphaera sp.]|nr:hypothetical protein [Pedosphaera sp.]
MNESLMNHEHYMKKLLTPLLTLCLIPLLTGCLTKRLWDGNTLVNRHFPSADPKLELFESSDRKDVLVEYDEETDKDVTSRRRAFFLMANQKKLSSGRPPRFVDPRTADKLQPIVLELAYVAPDTNAPVDLSLKAVLSQDHHSFNLVSAGKELGSFELPSYHRAEGTWARIALTPLAVTGDTVICAAAAAAIAGVFYVWGLGHGSSCSACP